MAASESSLGRSHSLSQSDIVGSSMGLPMVNILCFKSLSRADIYGFTADSEGANLPPGSGPWERFTFADVDQIRPPHVVATGAEITGWIERSGYFITLARGGGPA
jgi:hypothetical protein